MAEVDDSPEITMCWPRDLRPGDRIVAGFLPTGQAADIRYVELFELHRSRWVGVAFREDSGYFDSTVFLADPPFPTIPLEARADTGQGYSRADDGEDPQPAAGRVPAHTGAVVDGGRLVDETPGGAL